MEKGNKSKSIRERIIGGYLKVIALTIFLVVITVACLFFINRDYNLVIQARDNRSQVQTAIIGHYEWLEKLNESIQYGGEFTGSLDFNTCALGKWKAGLTQEDIINPTIKTALAAADIPHEKIHSTASSLLELGKTDKEAAMLQYVSEVKPQTAEVIAQLQNIDKAYDDGSKKAQVSLTVLIMFAIIFTVSLTVAITVFSIIYANRIAKNISLPVSTVSEWAKKLSFGVEELDFEEAPTDKIAIDEVTILITAFEAMTKSIKENSDVISRVAKGDMTAFVNIRSHEDSLGRNLYKMVQSNDILFNEIVEIAHTVATGSEEIAKASQSLAESASIQASSVSALSETVEYANNLISDSSEKSHNAKNITDKIKDDANTSNEKMKQLVDSVGEINIASQRISQVIKSIEDIAFQTNILALNAAVEAARAGQAGKGFAVVADEVRNLANKSAEAANESKTLIENTIQTTKEGSKNATEASETFFAIVEGINEIVDIIQQVAESSELQLEGIGKINLEIGQISQAASSNAAISEESAASSQEMSGNAELLRKAMGKFNLRNREDGHAYIPPEKKNDPEFIRVANEAYEKTQKTGEYGKVFIQPPREFSKAE